MFKRRTKKAADNSVADNAITADPGQNRQVASNSSYTYASPNTAAPSTVDDNEDAGEFLDQRMQRNLTVSRSGRYKSKTKRRPPINQPSSSIDEPLARAAASAGPQVGISSTGGYGPVVAGAATSMTSSAYRGLTTTAL